MIAKIKIIVQAINILKPAIEWLVGLFKKKDKK